MTNVIKNNIPNTVTCLNLFSGCIACVMAFEARYELALLFIASKFCFRFLSMECWLVHSMHTPSSEKTWIHWQMMSASVLLPH